MKNKSEKQTQLELRQRMQEIAALREEAEQRGLAFHHLSEKELVRKITGESSNSPYVYFVAHTLQTIPGGTATLALTISNPDPSPHRPLFVSMFFGLANFLDVPFSLSGRDTRWPYFSTPWFTLASGATTSKQLTYTAPSGVSAGTYLNNWVLWEGQWFDKGTVLERGFVELAVINPSYPPWA